MHVCNILVAEGRGQSWTHWHGATGHTLLPQMPTDGGCMHTTDGGRMQATDAQMAGAAARCHASNFSLHVPGEAQKRERRSI